MSEARRDRLWIELLSEEFELLRLIWVNDKNCVVNGGEKVCISGYGFKLEEILGRPVGHNEIQQRCDRLISHGLVAYRPGDGNRKLLSLSVDCKKILDVLGALK